jgi:hypothetical protein
MDKWRPVSQVALGFGASAAAPVTFSPDAEYLRAVLGRVLEVPALRISRCRCLRRDGLVGASSLLRPWLLVCIHLRSRFFRASPCVLPRSFACSALVRLLVRPGRLGCHRCTGNASGRGELTAAALHAESAAVPGGAAARRRRRHGRRPEPGMMRNARSRARPHPHPIPRRLREGGREGGAEQT